MLKQRYRGTPEDIPASRREKRIDRGLTTCDANTASDNPAPGSSQPWRCQLLSHQPHEAIARGKTEGKNIILMLGVTAYHFGNRNSGTLCHARQVRTDTFVVPDRYFMALSNSGTGRLQ